MRLHTAFFGLLLLTSTAYADPSWWAARGVISTTTAANLAPANIGQAKHMAAMALAELQGKLPATSHQALQADVALIADLSLPDPLPPGYHETQRAVLLNGQLKAIAKPFYDNLRTHNAAWLDNAMAAANLTVMEPGSNPLTPSPYPWSVATTDDANRAPATLGQLKAVFSLPLEMLTDISTTLDTDGDGMTDAWEIQYSLNPNDPSDANTDADNDGFSNLQEYQSNSNPTNASAIPGDRDGDSLADDLDAVPDDAEINWKKSPECHYVWIEQVTGASTGGGAPKHVNARGQILFEYSHPHPPIYETYPEETLDNVLWDSASQAWIPLATSGSGNSGKVIELFGLSDQGFVFGASHTFSDFQPDSPSVNSAGMIWKPSASSPNTYLSPTHFMPDVVNRITSGVDWRGTVSNDGIANCTTFRSNSTVGWETYNGSSTSPNLTYISGLGNEDRVPGAILDATASLMLLKSYQPGSSWSLKLYDGSQVANVDGLLPANNLGDYTPATDINITPSLKTNGQRRLWLTAHYYASGAYHYPVRIEKRAGGTGAARWHQPPSMAEGAWKLNERGEAIKSAKIWRNGTYTDLNTITSKSDTVTIIQAIDLASNGIILAQAERNGENKTGLLMPINIKAFKRGTLNTPGPEVPAGTGEFGYETVMMENADSESSATSTRRDCDESGASADLNAHRKANDNDLVKIVLKWPAGIKPAGASLKLLHDGMQVDATQTTPEVAVSTTGTSRLNFYKADGTRITNPTTDLQIADLANAPASSYLSKILTDGEVTIFIEGADRFGDLPGNRITRLGGAQLKWEFTQGTITATTKLLVYRGGFLRFLQPAGAPGAAGTFEFRDGKGRIRNRNDGYGQEFAQDDTDLGNVILTWSAKSGKTVASGANVDYRVGNGKGHTPPGWWTATENALPTSEMQAAKVAHAGQANETWKQASFCRWLQDDPTTQYSTAWEYHANNTHDSPIGRPTIIEFKFRLAPIAPTNPYNRTGLLIHPDGKRDGTHGCIGVQSYLQCQQLRRTLRNYHSLKLKVQIP